jgi:C1A family cysteine protease
MSVVYFYGAKPDTHDPRDLKKRYSQADIPSQWQSPNADLSGYVHHVYDQKSVASCTANALCAAYGLDLIKQSQQLSGGYYYFNPSRLFLYYNTREREHSVKYDSGASIRQTVKAMNCRGVCKESDWPYVVDKWKVKPDPSCYVAAEGNTLCKYERLDQDIDHMRACLKRDQCPFVFGFKVYRSFHSDSNRRHGNMPMPTASEKRNESEGRHAVVAVGYNDTTRRIKVLNSWGEDWGDGGYFYMPYEFIKDSDICFDFWKITFACERGKPHPKGTIKCEGGSSRSDPTASSSRSAGGACGYGGFEQRGRDTTKQY